MDLGFILLAVALTGLVIFIVAQPFFENRAAPAQADDIVAGLSAERDTILAAVRDLDFDHATGKIEDADYAAQRAKLMAQGAEVLKRLDAAGGGVVVEPIDPASAIEQAIAARRKTPIAATVVVGPRSMPAATCPGCGAAAAADARFCGQCGATLGRACAQCSARLAAEDRFCGACGAPVAEEARS